MVKEKTYNTAQEYINIVNELSFEIQVLNNILTRKRKTIEKTLAKLRAYKKRGIVKQNSKYNYEILKGE